MTPHERAIAAVESYTQANATDLYLYNGIIDYDNAAEHQISGFKRIATLTREKRRHPDLYATQSKGHHCHAERGGHERGILCKAIPELLQVIADDVYNIRQATSIMAQTRLRTRRPWVLSNASKKLSASRHGRLGSIW